MFKTHGTQKKPLLFVPAEILFMGSQAFECICTFRYVYDVIMILQE